MGPKEKVEINLRLEKNFHEALRRCVTEMGYTSLSEFIRLSIREKIRSECGNWFIEPVEVKEEDE